jgi:hypothetical protein
MPSPHTLRNAAQFLGLVAALWSCSESAAPFSPPPPPPATQAQAVSVAPDHAFASSPDITVTITGSGFTGSRHNRSWAVWSVSGEDTPLVTTFVSDTQLTALIPAALLTDPRVAELRVLGGDPMGDFPLRRSGPATFVVLPLSVPFSVSPTSAAAGSSDVTITVQGSGFHGGHHDKSLVLLSANGTDHYLATNFVNTVELTAVIPAALLSRPVAYVVSVATGDPMGDLPLSTQGAATLTVTP